MSHCPVCLRMLFHEPRLSDTLNDAYFVNCPRCGEFDLTGTAKAVLEKMPGLTDEKRMGLSHVLQKMHMTEDRPEINSDTVKKILETATLPTAREQADNLIRWLGDHSPEPGARVSAPDALEAIVGTISEDGLRFIIRSLEQDGLVVGGSGPRGEQFLNLTFSGWDRYEELKRGAPSGRSAFMAMKFDKALKRIVDKHFRPAVAQTGFVLKRLDDEPKAGLIDDRLRVEIKAARFMISDLTHDNSGAYWEAGYAEGLGKPVIYTCRRDVFKDTGTHFDTNHLLTVQWSEETLENDLEDLKASVRATIPEAKMTDD